MQVDLNDPTSIPAALVGISTVVDCATARPEESAQKIDREGKVALIQSAQVLASPLPCMLTGLLFIAAFSSCMLRTRLLAFLVILRHCATGHHEQCLAQKICDYLDM